MSENNGRGLFAILEEAGHDPAESFADRSLLEKTQSVTTAVAQGMLAFPSDQGAKGMNTVLDVANAAGIEKAIFKIINGGDMTGFEPRRFAGITDVTKGEREVSALEEGTSDIASVMSSMLITGGTSVGGHILNWGSKGNIGRKVFAEAVTTLPADILMSDDSGEHLLFDNNTKEHVIKRRAKNIAENAGMGVIGDFALRGMYKGYKAWRGAGKTSDDATQKVFNESVPAGQADEINKVRPTGELRGDDTLEGIYGTNPLYKIENRMDSELFDAQLAEATERRKELLKAFWIKNPKAKGFKTSRLSNEELEELVTGKTSGLDEEELRKWHSDRRTTMQDLVKDLGITTPQLAGKRIYDLSQSDFNSLIKTHPEYAPLFESHALEFPHLKIYKPKTSKEGYSKNVRKQMQNVSRAELDHRTAVQDNYVKASESAEIPFDNIHEGVSTETAKRVGLSGVEGAQRRDDYLNIFDTAMSGNIKDKLDEEFTLKFLRSMTDPTDRDVMSILEGGLKGKERESAMRRIREKFRNNPMLMDDAYFKEKANLSKVLTKELGLNNRKPRSLVDEYQDFLIASKTVRSNPKLAKELREWSTKTHLNEATLLKVLPHMKNVTDELPKYMRGFNDVLDKYAKGMVEESENLIKMFKETGNLDVSSPQYQKFISSFLSTSELYEGVAGVRSNVGRALRAIQEGTGSPAESFVAKHSEFYIKGKRDQDAMESASSYLRFAELTRKHQEITAKGVSDGRTPIQIAKDADKTTKELIKLVRGASNLDKAKRMVSSGLEGGREDLQDMAISMGIGNLLASPQTLGKIFNSTGIFTLYKQTLLPVWGGVVNMMTKGDTGQRPIADLLSSWYGLSRVAKRYASGDAKSLSRGFRGMQIEGQGFNQKTFRGLLDWVNENTNNPITRFGGRLMVAPMWFANQVMNKGIIPIDDFFRRVTMEIETERAIGNMYMRGISTTDNVFQKMSTSFDNIEDYRRSMLPLFTDLRNTLLNSKQWSNNKLEREMNAVFEKYAVTKTDLDARASIMAEIDRIERRGAEAVSQESTQDFLPAIAMRNTLNAIEANVPMGRFVAASLVPFQTAPMNIMRSAIEESGFLAPLSARWRSKFLSRKGSKEHTEAIAQVLSGLTVGMGAWTLVNSMEVYGHIPIEEISSAQELGVQPYSIVINGKAYSYDFLGTFKAPLAMMADYKRYGMDGNNLEAFTKALGTFALSAGNNPYFDSMKELTDFTAGGASTKDWARLLASKSTQFLQFGTGLDRAYDALSGGEQEVSAMNKFYDNVWLRELDQRNKDNPIYRYFRDMTNPKAYVRKTNIFGEGMTRNGGDPSAWGPYLFLGASNLPAPTSPGIVMLKELDLVNRDFTRIGDVQISGQKAQELKKKIFSDSGLGLARLLNHYATSESFMSAPDSYRKKVLSGIINQHTKSVESTFDLETVSKQYELEQIMNQLDYDSRGAEILNNASASQMGEAVYNSGVNKIKKGSITRDKMLEAYK